MLCHVVVPLDGSNLSEQALAYAKDVLCENGKITLVSIVELPMDTDYALVDIPMTVVAARAYSEDDLNVTYRRVRDYLESKARQLTNNGYEVQTVVETGDPATVIVDIAHTHDVDAIVMTTHGRTGLSRWLFGSVTQKVVSTMPCPVLVVPGKQRKEQDSEAESTVTES